MISLLNLFRFDVINRMIFIQICIYHFFFILTRVVSYVGFTSIKQYVHFDGYLFRSVAHRVRTHRCYYNMFVIENGTDVDLRFAQYSVCATQWFLTVHDSGITWCSRHFYWNTVHAAVVTLSVTKHFIIVNLLPTAI